jgi:hypothetical protein
LSLLSTVKFAYWAYLARPAGDRTLFRVARRLGARSIVEIGVSDLRRTLRLLRLARDWHPQGAVRYAAIDAFDLRASGQAPLPLKATHCALRHLGVSARLLPGGVVETLVRWANELQGVDIVVVSGRHAPHELAGAWFWLPRMLHARSVVLLEHGRGPQRRFEPLTLEDVRCRGRDESARRAA